MRTRGDRFAYCLSQISSPFVVGFGVLGYVSLSTASTVTAGLHWLTVIGVGLPLVGLMALGGMLAGLLLLSASRPLVAVIVSFALATLITQVVKYKISLHVDSAAGAVTVCFLLASPVYLSLSPLVVLIAWARWKLEAHSALQAICGAALAVVVTVTTFWLFGLR